MKKILIIGSLNIDFVVNVKNMPAVGETILSDNMELIPGGKGANQACAVAKLGGNVTMLGAVGKDVYADRQFNSLKAAGVDVSHILQYEDINTGIALITVNEKGDNSIVVIPGANKYVSIEYIDHNLELIKECDIVVIQLEVPLDTVVYASKLAKGLGKLVILDPAPAPRYFPEELYHYIDIIKPNETELSILTGIQNAENHLEEASKILKEFGVKCVIVTLGENGVFVNLPDNTMVTIPGKKVNVVDSTAAGDTFTAAMAVKLANGEDLLSAIEYANLVASIVVTKRGAQSSIPTKEEIDGFDLT